MTCFCFSMKTVSRNVMFSVAIIFFMIRVGVGVLFLLTVIRLNNDGYIAI